MIAPLPLLLACADTPVDGWFVVVEGRVVAADGAPLDAAEVALFAPDGAPVAVTTTGPDGAWTLPILGDALAGNQLVAFARADGYAEGRATFDLNLAAPRVTSLSAGPGQTWDTTARRLSAIQLAPAASTATVAGRVVDAATGLPVGGAALTVQHGWNAPIGAPAVATAVTDAEGRYAATVDRPGAHTVSVAAADGWGAARFPAMFLEQGGSSTGAVAQETAPGALVATVLWGDSPTNLDLHLTGPLRGGQAGADGNGRFHVWSGAPRHPTRDDVDAEAVLVLADADGRGPETVTLTDPGRGELRLTVFDADNWSDAENLDLAASGAVLQVWWGEDYPRYYTIDPTAVATAWQVVEIDVETGVSYVNEAYGVGADPTDPDAF